MSVRIHILAQYKGESDTLRQLCGRPVRTSGDWNWTITDPVHRPFQSTDLTQVRSLSLRISLEDGDWMMEIFSEGSRVLRVRDHEEDGVSVAKALASTGLPVASEEQLAEALEYKSITAGEKAWPVGSLPRILELLSLNDIFPNWRDDLKKEEEFLAAQSAPAPANKAEVPFEPDALYNGRSGWFREITNRTTPESIEQAAAECEFTQLGIVLCSKYEDLCFAVFRHNREPIYLIYELEFQLTTELLSFPGDGILVTCNHAYPVISDAVIPKMLPRKPLSELLARQIEELKMLPAAAPTGTLYDFCILYDRYISGNQ